MIRKYRNKGSFLTARVMASPSYYAVESEVCENLVYVLDTDELAMLRGSQAWRIPWDEVPALADKSVIEGLKEEMLGLMNDRNYLAEIDANLENEKRYTLGEPA